MEKYQIIPRKFRPKTFSEVAGHEAVVSTIKNAIAHGRIGQAYLFCGSRGCGKTTLARLFAKSLNCEALTEQIEPCNECVSCTEIAKGSSLDLIEIDGASNRGIEDIRQINETIGYAPSRGKYKIYLIDEVHMLTKEAFNALLKTLEEPPERVKFFFATTESHKIPATIISRCQRFNLSRIPKQALVGKLKRICSEIQIEAEEAALEQIGLLSEGSLRDAESLLDQLICFGKTPITLTLTREVFGLLSMEQLKVLDEAIHQQDMEKGMEIAKLFYESGKDIGACVDSILEHFRSYLLLHLGQSSEGLYHEAKSPYTKEQCLVLVDTLLDWQQQIQKTPFKRIHLEMLIATLIRKSKTVSLDQLIARLLTLEETYGIAPSQTVPKEEPKQQPQITPNAKPVESVSSNSDEIAKEEPKQQPQITPNAKPVESVSSNSDEIAKEEPKQTGNKPIEATASEIGEKVKVKTKNESKPAEAQNTPSIHPSRYDTLMRFAAVELEGSIHTQGSN